MGSKAAIITFGEVNSEKSLHDHRLIDFAKSKRFAERILGGSISELEPIALDRAIWPDPGVVCAAHLPDCEVFCSREIARSKPSELTGQISQMAAGRNAYGVFMHSVDDWAACAIWLGGQLRRSVSANPSSGVIEDVGERLPFEIPFWDGKHPVRNVENYALPFHPIDFGNEALREFFGFILEGSEDDSCFDPEEVEIPAFRTG